VGVGREYVRITFFLFSGLSPKFLSNFCLSFVYVSVTTYENFLWLKSKASQDQSLNFKNKSQPFICYLKDKAEKNRSLN